jgi:hypothetical protein
VENQGRREDANRQWNPMVNAISLTSRYRL